MRLKIAASLLIGAGCMEEATFVGVCRDRWHSDTGRLVQEVTSIGSVPMQMIEGFSAQERRAI